MSNDTKLRIERIIDAPREKVFAAWTTREAMEEWYADGDGYVAKVTELDLRVGGRYRVEWGPAGSTPYREHGEYLEIDPPNRLVMTETLDASEPMWWDTKVTVELTDEGGKTKLVLVHEGFPSAERRTDAQGGWPGFIDRLERYVLAHR